jgi:hypothetical protein
MNMQRTWPGTASSRWNPYTRSVGRFASGGLLVATTAAALLCGSAVAHSGPCTPQIEQLERQIGQASSGIQSGPTAPQSIEAQLHHQPTPAKVREAEHRAIANAVAVLQRARQADSEGSLVACTEALTDAKHHWLIPLKWS